MQKMQDFVWKKSRDQAGVKKVVYPCSKYIQILGKFGHKHASFMQGSELISPMHNGFY